MFSQNRQQLRQMYFDVWSKMQRNEALSTLENQIAQIINQHPEYRELLTHPERIDTDYPLDAGQTNPFLHMSLHLSIHEQVATDRPAGIREIYHQLVQACHDSHHAEHQMMTPLAESLWQASHQPSQATEHHYLQTLRHLLKYV